MGFGDWLMRGLGFDSKNKQKTAVAEPEADKYADFNMHIKQTEAETKVEAPTRNNFQADPFGMSMNDNLIIYTPNNMKDIQSAVDCLRQNQSVMLDLENIGDEDRTRVLDFISGAIYGLNGSIHRFKDDSFILTPAGKKILTPDKKD